MGEGIARVLICLVPFHSWLAPGEGDPELRQNPPKSKRGFCRMQSQPCKMQSCPQIRGYPDCSPGLSGLSSEILNSGGQGTHTVSIPGGAGSPRTRGRYGHGLFDQRRGGRVAPGHGDPDRSIKLPEHRHPAKCRKIAGFHLITVQHDVEPLPSLRPRA